MNDSLLKIPLSSQLFLSAAGQLCLCFGEERERLLSDSDHLTRDQKGAGKCVDCFQILGGYLIRKQEFNETNKRTPMSLCLDIGMD